MAKDKIWKGRIEEEPDLIAEKFTSSIEIDRHIYKQDITATAAYAAGLESIGIISAGELEMVFSGLKKIKDNIEKGSIKYQDYEDIHSLVEYELTRIAGVAAEKIHTGRSRNDQVVVDEMLFIRELIVETASRLIILEKAILDMADKNRKIIFPAYTHMQKAQPVLFSHYMLSYLDKFSRNIKKLIGLFKDTDFLPLGAAACAGSGYKINQKLIAELLKFSKIGTNSMDIVSSRDFIADYIYCCSMIMLNLSRFCEDLIIYNSQEFSFIEIDESFCTGSSIKKQKKNPDILELIRGKSAVVIGNLTQILTLIKGLPSTYNSDLQEDKKILLNARDETLGSIEIFSRILTGIKLNKNNIEKSLKSGFPEATDAADYLSKKGLSFRKAHNTVGKIVRYCIENAIALKELPLEKLRKYSEYFDSDFYEFIDIESCIEAKITACGTSTGSLIKNISRSKKDLDKFEEKINLMLDKIPDLDTIISFSKP
jgi:argininosuccinate lyase